MYAIVDIQGKQYKVRKNDVVNVERLEAKEKDKIKFDKVLLCSNGVDCLVGQPYLKDTKVEAEVLGETKGRKVIAFKYKRRKGYHRKVGHRQKFSVLKIINIESSLQPKKEEKPKVEKVKEEVKVEKPKVKKTKVEKVAKINKTKKKQAKR